MLLVQVPPGSFYMGATRRAGERNSHPQATSAEGPVRKVTLTKSAWLGRTPVTVAEYRLFTQATHYPEPKTLIPGLINARPDQPVVGVSWFDAQAFVSWLSEKSGLPYCLPSEALWEWAARGSDGRHYPWGKKAPNQDSCWLGERFPQDVGKKPANMGPFGNLDQLGNIQEFCQDVWSIWTDDPVTDPLSDDSGWTHFPADQRPEEPFRVLRGCGIPTSMPAQRVSMRVQVRPHHFFHWYGFRVALPVER
jgi:formylglycine-generating enzyme required for sulfatase activity